MKNIISIHNSFKALEFHPAQDIILYGAGLYAEPIVHAVRQRGLIPRLLLDNSPLKHGKEIAGVPVVSPAEGWRLYPDATVIISSAPRHFSELHARVSEVGWKRVIDGSAFLASFDYRQDTFPFGISLLHFHIDRYFYEYFLQNAPELLIVPSLDIVITERCSLRCRDCANLMQLYEHPTDLDFDQLFRSLDQLMSAVDHVLEFRVLGGETFMNKNAWCYIERLNEYPNFTRIAVYSNGTIIPQGKNLDCLKSENTYLRISDYGPLSGKVKVLTTAFDDHHIMYDVQKVSQWQDCAEIRLRERTSDELSNVFSSCCASNTLTILKGHLYHCPFAANAANLKAHPNFPGDSIVLDPPAKTEDIRHALFAMLREKPFFSACNYCAGRPDDETPLPAAIQARRPLPFVKYQ